MPPPMDTPVVMPSYFEPIDVDIPSSSIDVGGPIMNENQSNYSIAGYLV